MNPTFQQRQWSFVGHHGDPNIKNLLQGPQRMPWDMPTEKRLGFASNALPHSDQAAAKLTHFDGVVQFSGSLNNQPTTGLVKQVGFSLNRGPIFELKTTTGQTYMLLGYSPSFAGTLPVFGTTRAAFMASSLDTNGQPMTDGRVYAIPVDAANWNFWNTNGYPGGSFSTSLVAGAPINVCALSELSGFTDLNSSATNAAYGYYLIGTNATPANIWTVQTNGNVALGTQPYTPVTNGGGVNLSNNFSSGASNTNSDLTNEDLAALLAAQGDNGAASDKTKDNTGLYVGVGVGGFLLLVIIGLVIWKM